MLFLYSYCLEVACCLWVFHSVESTSVLLFLSYCCCQQSIIRLQKSAQSSTPNTVSLRAALARVLQGSFVLLVCSTLSQWGCPGDPKGFAFHTYLCPKLLLSLHDPAVKLRGAGLGKGVVSSTFKVCPGRPSMLCSCLVFASLASWSLLRQNLFLFVFSFWRLGFFFLISERFQLAVLSCLEAISKGACPLQPHPSSPSSPIQGEETAESAQPRHLALPALVVSCPEKSKVPPVVLALTEFPASMPAAFLSRTWPLERRAGW